MDVIALGLVAMTMWGLSDYVLSRAGKKLDHYFVNFYLQFLGPFLLVPFIIFNGSSIFSNSDIFLTMVTAGFFTVAYINFIACLSKGPVGVAAPIANTYPAATLVVSILIFSSTITFIEGLALFVIMLGAFLASSDDKTFHIRNFKGYTVQRALAAAVFWGIGFAVIGQVVDDYPWYEPLFAINIWMALITFFLAISRKTSRTAIAKEFKKPQLSIWLAGITLTAGSIGFYKGAEIDGRVLIVAVIASASPLITAFLARVYEKEKINWLQRAGAVVIVLGIALLNF